MKKMNRKKGIVQEHGINDMPNGWSKDNKKLYQLWQDVLKRVYSDRIHNKQPTYINTTLQLEWHWLSYFVEHISEIDGYDEEKFLNGELELDKDIKSNGKNKEYSVKNCIFVSKSENAKQAMKTRDYSDISGKHNYWYGKPMSEERKQNMIKKLSDGRLKYGNNPRSKKIKQLDLNGELIKIWNCGKEISDKFGFKYRTFMRHARGDNGYTHKYKGFIWIQVEEESDEE